MNISELIGKLRREKNMTQKQLAKLIHKSEVTVKKYETGEITPPSDVFLDILNTLGVNLYINSDKDNLLRKYIESKNNTIDDKKLNEMEIFINEYIDFKLSKIL